jgi:UDP-glucose 4-epimerase
MFMAILVCGGAGYIGSHAVHQLIARGEEVVIVDNLQTGHRGALHPQATFCEGDIRDAAALDRIFTERSIEAVIHFAANSLVGESMEKPLLYFNNNVYGMQVLLEAMVRHGVDKIVFSSTAAVYGEPKRVPIREDDETNPTNAYGETKLTMEKMMKWVSRASGVRYVSLRYFNAAGALPDGSIGEDHKTETHLIPLILQVPTGRRDHITVYGDDYPTPDGTCLRDYIHVVDLADAHMRALDYLRRGGESDIFNLGSGSGFSVKEMIAAAEKATGKAIAVEIGARRAGDPAQLIASSEKARTVLGWQPQFTDVEEVIGTAWRWHAAHPHGYED